MVTIPEIVWSVEGHDEAQRILRSSIMLAISTSLFFVIIAAVVVAALWNGVDIFKVIAVLGMEYGAIALIKCRLDKLNADITAIRVQKI